MDCNTFCRNRWLRWLVKGAIFGATCLITGMMLFDGNGFVQEFSWRISQRYIKIALPLKNYSVPGCNCSRVGLAFRELNDAKEWPELMPKWFHQRFSFEGESTCSDFATQRGANQRVVAYSYYTLDGSPEYTRYLLQLHRTAKDIESLYPGWIMRIYHNVTENDVYGTQQLCRLFCQNEHVDLCHVHHLPGLGNLNQKDVVGRMWRFAVMGDPTVEAFLSRDTDSWVLEREAAAVHDWLQSGHKYHVMHDHPVHRALILAGLWGGLNKDREKLAEMRDQMFSAPKSLKKAFDQELLLNIVWPVIKEDVLNHDSYTCQEPEHLNARPFPTQRDGIKYCGWGMTKRDSARRIADNPCPIVCRPQDHLDWKKC